MKILLTLALITASILAYSQNDAAKPAPTPETVTISPSTTSKTIVVTVTNITKRGKRKIDLTATNPENGQTVYVKYAVDFGKRCPYISPGDKVEITYKENKPGYWTLSTITLIKF